MALIARASTDMCGFNPSSSAGKSGILLCKLAELKDHTIT